MPAEVIEELLNLPAVTGTPSRSAALNTRRARISTAASRLVIALSAPDTAKRITPLWPERSRTDQPSSAERPQQYQCGLCGHL